MLRYWESEFEQLEPEKTKSGQRIYRREDIELIFLVKELLYTQMYTIAGARRQLELKVQTSNEQPSDETADLQAQLNRQDLQLQSYREEIEQAAQKLSSWQKSNELLQAQVEVLEQDRQKLGTTQQESKETYEARLSEIARERNALVIKAEQKDMLVASLQRKSDRAGVAGTTNGSTFSASCGGGR